MFSHKIMSLECLAGSEHLRHGVHWKVESREVRQPGECHDDKYTTMSKLNTLQQPPTGGCINVGAEVLEVRQLGHVCRDCLLMKVGQVIHAASSPTPFLSLRGTYCVLARCYRGILQAMVDSDCTQSMIHQNLVWPGGLLEAS